PGRERTGAAAAVRGSWPRCADSGGCPARPTRSGTLSRRRPSPSGGHAMTDARRGLRSTTEPPSLNDRLTAVARRCRDRMVKAWLIRLAADPGPDADCLAEPPTPKRPEDSP